MSNTKNVKLGVCHAYFNGVDLGYTQGGVEVTVKTDTHKVNVDQFGKTTINEVIMGREVTVKVPMAETTLENMTVIMPGSTMTLVGGSIATGTITIATQPADADTVTVNGTKLTFRTAPTKATEVLIGASVSATATNLAAVLSALADPNVAAATYTVLAGVVTVNYGERISFPNGEQGAIGNSFTLATNVPAKVTLSGATLAGGVDPTSARVDVSTAIGTNLLATAMELRLHPVAKAAGDLSEDFVIPLANTAGAMQFAYALEKERIYNVDFTGYPDPVTGKLFYVGQ